MEYNNPSGCSSNNIIVESESYTNVEQLCVILKQIQTLQESFDNIDLDISGKEDSDNITNVRLLSENGDFTGTWEGMTKADFTTWIQSEVDDLQDQIDLLDLEDIRIELKFDTEVVRLDLRIDNERVITDAQILDLETRKENSIDITNDRLLSDSADFTGTWTGETYNDFKDHITNGETLYADVIALINANPNIGITVIDGGFLASAVVPTFIDNGLVTDLPTEEKDRGFIINPCSCTP